MTVDSAPYEERNPSETIPGFRAQKGGSTPTKNYESDVQILYPGRHRLDGRELVSPDFKKDLLGTELQARCSASSGSAQCD